jgi:hypothetical protein
MAFPWETLSRARLASGNIVEDMQLSFDLLTADHAPRYCAEALVTASLRRERSCTRCAGSMSTCKRCCIACRAWRGSVCAMRGRNGCSPPSI